MPATPEEIEELGESFRYNDSDNDGRISLDEFVNMLFELETQIEPEQARIGFREIDTDRDGAIELNEFVEWWCER